MAGLFMKLNEKIETMMMAATFAEAGEWDTARDMMQPERKAQKRATRNVRKRSGDNRPRMRL